jgi:hypothetical protein
MAIQWRVVKIGEDYRGGRDNKLMAVAFATTVKDNL